MIKYVIYNMSPTWVEVKHEKKCLLISLTCIRLEMGEMGRWNRTMVDKLMNNGQDNGHSRKLEDR